MKRSEGLGDELHKNYKKSKQRKTAEQFEKAMKELTKDLPFSTNESIEAAIVYMEDELRKSVTKGFRTFAFLTDRFHTWDRNFPGWNEEYTKLSPDAYILLSKASLEPLFNAFIARHPEIKVVSKDVNFGKGGCYAQFVAPIIGVKESKFYFQWSLE